MLGVRYPCVIKPISLSASQDVMRADGREDFLAAITRLKCLFERPELLHAAITDLFARAARGELRVVVGATYPLADAAQAQIDLAGRRTTGKLLLDPRA